MSSVPPRRQIENLTNRTHNTDMEYKTIAGNYYTITSKSGCTVTDSTGTLSMTVDAGGQLTVQAPSDKLVYDDEQAIVFKANFNHAALALRLLGGGDKLPAGYTRVAFIQGAGQQYINTNATGNETSEVLCTFERTTTAGKSVYCSGASNNLLCLFVWGDRMDSLRFDWLNSQRTYPDTYPGGMVTTVQSARGVTLNGNQIVEAFPEGSFTAKNIRLFTIDSTATSFTADNVRMARWALKNAGQPVRDMVAVIDPTGVTGMYDLVGETFYKTARGSNFIAGMTLAQARNLGKLPAGTTLTVSLPVGYDSDAGVVAALTEAEANGCVLTIQTYEVASAATTFALRRVWVRKVQDENGSYVAADGKRWQIDWCVDVIGADPETLGYERFRSVDAATEYWGLVPYEHTEELSTEA